MILQYQRMIKMSDCLLETYSIIYFVTGDQIVLARVVGIPAGRRLGGRLATTLVVTINNINIFILFSFISSRFSSVVYFSHRRNAWIKKLI